MLTAAQLSGRVRQKLCLLYSCQGIITVYSFPVNGKRKVFSENGQNPGMKKYLLIPAEFTLGGLLYGLCEILFRGHTHWSMVLAGGLSLSLLGRCARREERPLWQTWVMGMCVITAVEFVTGCVVNLRMGLQVWDYSRHRFHLMGQICPLFSLCWLLLSIPAVALCRLLRRLLGA